MIAFYWKRFNIFSIECAGSRKNQPTIGQLTVNTEEFPHITTKDKILLDAIARASKCGNLIEDVTANVPADQIKNIPQFAKEIRETTRELESAVRRIDRNERVPMYVQMINLYGRGMLMFGWDY